MNECKYKIPEFVQMWLGGGMGQFSTTNEWSQQKFIYLIVIDANF